MKRRAIFLDKDGTLVENVPYNVDPSRVVWARGVPEGLRQLQQAGFDLFIITNQSGVARGYFPETALVALVEYLRSQFHEFGVTLAGFYYCPHHPDGVVSPYAIDCDCRKPQPGLLRQAAQEHDIDLAQSWFVGDILHDVEAGRAAGCRTVLIDNGNETEWELSLSRLPHHIVPHFLEAAQLITAISSETVYPSFSCLK